MNTTFRILWFEDELTWFNMENMRVKAILERHDLTPYVTRKNGDDFHLDELIGNDYDLILMDYKLAEGTTGDVIVASLRENNVLTDIVFYSSEESAMISAIQRKMPPIDGVYLTQRDYVLFTEKVEKIIRKIVKRSEDIVNLRGFVMDGSCDFEVRIHEILNIAWSKFKEEERKTLEGAVEKNIKRNDKLIADTKKRVVEHNPLFPAAVNQPHFFSHSDRLYLLTKVISILQKNYGLRKDELLDNFKSNYETDISHYRNALGHKKAADDTIAVTKGFTVPIDENLHRKMRKNIHLYNSMITELENFITSDI